MSTTDILKSLANFEQSLRDINSAKNQVTEVVQSSSKLADVIASYRSSFEGISSNIKQMLDKSKELNLNVLSELSKQTDNLTDEISKLSAINFDTQFQTIQQEIVKQFEKELLTRLVHIDKTTKDLQVKIDQLEIQISRLESIDLEQHFNKHQEILIKFFPAITSINLTLSGITQSLTTINEGIETIHTNQNKILIRLDKQDNVLKTTETGLAVILNKLANHQQEIHAVIEAIRNENFQTFVKLHKGIKINRVMQICCWILLIIVLGGVIWFNVITKMFYP